MRVVIFGANGPTGRLLTTQRLADAHDVVAVTRHPAQIQPRSGLTVAATDATDTGAVREVIAGSDAVASALGTPYNRPSASTRPAPRKDAGDEALLALARQAAAEHQNQRGQPITRD